MRVCFLRHSLAVICCGFVASTCFGADGWRWRTNKLDNGQLLLAFTETEATDDLGALRFYCRPASGRIDVFGSAGEKERKILADFIRSDAYPKVQLEGEASFVEPSFSEVAGWEYHFEIGADGAVFNKFKNTGRFGFKFGSHTADFGSNPIAKSGLDKVAEFQAQCRKPAVDGAPRGAKAQQ